MVVASPFAPLLQSFKANVQTVDRLLDFDRVIIETAVEGLQELADNLGKLGSRSAAKTVSNRAQLLANIKKADSLRPQYETMFNQCVVLLVSHFASAVHALCRHGIIVALSKGTNVPVITQELKLSWRAIAEAETEREGLFADLLISQQDISFQDMQSISRAFKDHLNIQLKRSVDTNNVILGQAARHVIVHAAGVVDNRMLRQISGCRPRTLKENLSLGERLQFSPQEVRLLSGSMINYVDHVTSRLNDAFL
jgi:hypothetical protein